MPTTIVENNSAPDALPEWIALVREKVEGLVAEIDARKQAEQILAEQLHGWIKDGGSNA